MNWTSIEKKLVNIETKIIAISDAVKNHIFNQIKEEDKLKVTRIYNGVDINEFNPQQLKKSILKNEYNLDENKIIIGVVGRFDEWKKFDLFVEAANILKRKYNNLCFFIVGDAFDSEQVEIKNKIKKIINNYNLNDDIILTGYRKDVNAIMNDFDIFVLTSDNEPFGRVLIEALALNLPVVSTNNGGAPEIIRDNENGVLVQVNNVEEIVKGIEKIIMDDKLRNYMKKHNREYAEKYFSIESHVSLVQSLYNEI